MSQPFDMSGLMGLFGGFQQRMADLQASAKTHRSTGKAGGGLVVVVATGEFQLESITIAQEAYEDRELLEDLVRAATNDALRQARDHMQAQLKGLTGGLPLPPGLLGF